MCCKVDGQGILIDQKLKTSKSYDHGSRPLVHAIEGVWLNGSRAEAFMHVTRDGNRNHEAALKIDPCVVIFRIRGDHPISLTFAHSPHGKSLQNAWYCPIDIPLEYCVEGYETIEISAT